MVDASRVPLRMHEDEVEVDEALVRRLVEDQFPDLAARRLTMIEPWGTDNAIWRLGDDLVVRLPRIHWAVDQVGLEATWLPRLAPHLPVAIPRPVAVGAPGHGYPHHWALHRWLPGTNASRGELGDPVGFARALAAVVRALWKVSTDGAPAARNRARPLEACDVEARSFIERSAEVIDADAALEAWDRALRASPHEGPPVWVHGDLDGNCLVDGGRLSGIVDWGSACVGDPAVDVAVVWSSLFTAEARSAFLEALDVDGAALDRSRGAVVHQACGAISYYGRTYPQIVDRSWHRLAAIGVGPR